jgi:hypothetical protein
MEIYIFGDSGRQRSQVDHTPGMIRLGIPSMTYQKHGDRGHRLESLQTVTGGMRTWRSKKIQFLIGWWEDLVIQVVSGLGHPCCGEQPPNEEGSDHLHA